MVFTPPERPRAASPVPSRRRATPARASVDLKCHRAFSMPCLARNRIARMGDDVDDGVADADHVEFFRLPCLHPPSPAPGRNGYDLLGRSRQEETSDAAQEAGSVEEASQRPRAGSTREIEDLRSPRSDPPPSPADATRSDNPQASKRTQEILPERRPARYSDLSPGAGPGSDKRSQNVHIDHQSSSRSSPLIRAGLSES